MEIGGGKTSGGRPRRMEEQPLTSATTAAATTEEEQAQPAMAQQQPTTYEHFLRTHGSQLEGIGLPETLWKVRPQRALLCCVRIMTECNQPAAPSRHATVPEKIDRAASPPPL